MRVLGLMSGTSADGVDAVLAEFTGPPRRPRWRLLSRASHPYPAALQRQLTAIGQNAPSTASELLELGEAVTEQQAAAARACDPQGRATLVGCHGQTLWHRPPQVEHRGNSWQLLQGPLLAELLQRPVVFDFRAADLALGGQGAPLVPAADAELLSLVQLVPAVREGEFRYADGLMDGVPVVLIERERQVVGIAGINAAAGLGEGAEARVETVVDQVAQARRSGCALRQAAAVGADRRQPVRRLAVPADPPEIRIDALDGR